MVSEISQSVRNTLLTRLGSARAMQRVASPSIVIGLGSTACQITQHLNDLTSGFARPPRIVAGTGKPEKVPRTERDLARCGDVRYIYLTVPVGTWSVKLLNAAGDTIQASVIGHALVGPG